MSEEVLIPTPDEVEKVMVQKELDSQKKETNPLDAHAQLFYLYMPRFRGQLNFMSSKQLIKLVMSLIGSNFNKDEDVNQLASTIKGMNKNGLLRVINSVIEHPLNEAPFKLMSKKEQKFFHNFDALITNKYMECIKSGLEKKEKDPEAIKQVEDVIIHSIDTQSGEFQRRSQVEKDAFATGSKLLASKFMMLMVTFLEEQKNIEEIEKENLKGETNG